MDRVVLIDDELWTLAGLRNTFDWASRGFEVVGEFGSSLEALAYLQRRPADVVFTDIRMPGLSGIDLLRRLRESGSDVEVVIISGFTEFEYARDAIHWGAVEYLVKPVSMDEADTLLLRLRNRIDDRNRRKDLEVLESLANDTCDMRDLFLERGMEAKESGFLCLLVEWKECGASGKRVHIQGYPGVNIHTGRMRSYLILNTPIGFEPEPEDFAAYRTDLDCPRIGVAQRAVEQNRLPESMRQARLAFESIFVDASKVGGIYGFQAEPLQRCIDALRDAWTEGGPGTLVRAVAQVSEIFRSEGLGAEEAAGLWNRIQVLLPASCSAVETVAPDALVTRFSDFEGLLAALQEQLSNTQAEASDRVKVAETGLQEEEIRSENRAFNELLAYMRVHFAEPLQIRNLADRYHISLSYCCLLFRKTLSKTFSEYLADLRMANAAELLKEGTFSLAEISERIGFNDYYYFIRAFRKYYGITPSRYRKGQV
jgi:AraC-like DNA-binding protein/FixJ family two-component response regulator